MVSFDKKCALTLLLTADDLLQEVHGDIRLRRKVDPGVDGQEGVDFALRTILGRESRYGYDLAITSWDLRALHDYSDIYLNLIKR